MYLKKIILSPGSPTMHGYHSSVFKRIHNIIPYQRYRERSSYKGGDDEDDRKTKMRGYGSYKFIALEKNDPRMKKGVNENTPSQQTRKMTSPPKNSSDLKDHTSLESYEDIRSYIKSMQTDVHQLLSACQNLKKSISSYPVAKNQDSGTNKDATYGKTHSFDDDACCDPFREVNDVVKKFAAKKLARENTDVNIRMTCCDSHEPAHDPNAISCQTKKSACQKSEKKDVCQKKKDDCHEKKDKCKTKEDPCQKHDKSKEDPCAKHDKSKEEKVPCECKPNPWANPAYDPFANKKKC